MNNKSDFAHFLLKYGIGLESCASSVKRSGYQISIFNFHKNWNMFNLADLYHFCLIVDYTYPDPLTHNGNTFRESKSFYLAVCDETTSNTKHLRSLAYPGSAPSFESAPKLNGRGPALHQVWSKSVYSFFCKPAKIISINKGTNQRWKHSFGRRSQYTHVGYFAIVLKWLIGSSMSQGT